MKHVVKTRLRQRIGENYLNTMSIHQSLELDQAKIRRLEDIDHVNLLALGVSLSEGSPFQRCKFLNALSTCQNRHALKARPTCCHPNIGATERPLSLASLHLQEDFVTERVYPTTKDFNCIIN